LLGFASLHNLANNYQPLKWALCFFSSSSTKESNLETSDYIAIGASLFALLSAIYARWTWSEAKKANDISRINSLLTLKEHYSELRQKEHDKSRAWLDGKDNKVSDGYTEACEIAAADYQQKYRQASEQLEKLKPKVLNSET